MMRTSLLAFSLIIISCLGSFASYDTSFAQYKIRRMSPVGGLGVNGQRDVRQDKWGFVWVITVNNLFRFDGYTFKHYTNKLEKPDTASSWSFERLEVDKSGDIYITSNFGLLKYNPLTDNFDYLFRGSVKMVEEDSKGRLWMSTPSALGLYNRKTLEFSPIDSDEGPVRNVSAICVNSRRIYVGTSTGNIYVFDEKAGSCIHVFSQPQYNIVDISNTDSILYVLTENMGLIKISSDTYRELKTYDFFYPEHDVRVSARALFIDKYKHLWITSQRGIYIFNPINEEYTHYAYDKTDPYGMPSSSVWRISEDQQGNLWFGTYSGGLCFVNLNERKKLRTFNGRIDDLSYTVVSSFEEDDRYLWIGTEGGGLNRYDKLTGAFYYFRHKSGANSLSYDNIQCLLYARNHKLWIGTSRGGMDCLDTKSGSFTHYTVGNRMLVNDHVERIVAEADSGLWLKYLMDRDRLTYLSLEDNTTKHFDFRAAPILQEGNIGDINRGRGDTLWVASSYRLLVMNVRTKEVSVAPYAQSDIPDYRNINIRTILTDHTNNRIWIGTTGNGLLMYDIAAQSLHREADLSKYGVHSIYSINIDKHENLWCGTNNGLFLIDVQRKTVQQFNKEDGAQGTTYYPFSTFRSKTGRLYFGGNEGFTVIDTLKNTYNEYKPRVVISDFLLDHSFVVPGISGSPLKSSIFQTEQLTLKHNQNNFSFEFISTNYLNPGKNRFQYRLVGYDNRWTETDAGHRLASYSKVPQGRYIFEIMTANNDGVWGDCLAVRLNIRSAPWLSWWALTGYLLLLSVAVYMLIRYHNYQRALKLQFYLEEQERKQKEEAHQEQLKFFTNVSHDFRTPLSLILGALEAVKAGNAANRYLPALENNAKRLLALVNELMDFRSIQNRKIRLCLSRGEWNKFVADSSSDFYEYAKQKEISFEMNFDSSGEDTPELYFDEKIVEKIILNLLNNAFKYTPAEGSITVSTLFDISKFESSHANSIIVKGNEESVKMFGLVISDSGVGISGESICYIFERYYRISESEGARHLGSGIGLALVKSLVELHRGYIAIYSERDKGSDVVIGFPADASTYQESDFDKNKAGDLLSKSIIVNDICGKENPRETRPKDAVQHKRKIILAEDNDDLRDLLVEILSAEYDVLEAINGIEAMEILENDNPEVVITDLMMPEMDGVELCRKIKGGIETSHVPVIMLTAKSGIENRIEGLQSGADAYLEKPVNRQILLLTLQNIFSRQARIKEFYAKHYFAGTAGSEALVNRREAGFMSRLIKLIESNLANTEIDVLQIARSLAVSRRTLYGKVKALTGQSVVEFIRNYRLRRAAQILAEEDSPINDIMIRVGIDNASYFSRIFKKEFGESPSEFASHHRKDKA